MNVLGVKIVDGYLVVSVDPNKNGVALLELKLNLAEVPAEVVALFAAKHAEALAAAAPAV